MTGMPPYGQAHRDEAAEVLQAASEICGRLDQWASTPASSPLVIRTQAQVQLLSAEVHALQAAVSHNDSEQERVNVRDAVKRCQYMLVKTLDILSFASRHQGNGIDAAINDLFYHTGGRAQNPYDADNQLRLAQDFAATFAPWFGPLAAPRNFSWGTNSSGCPELGAVLTEMKDELVAFLQRAAEKVTPGYVHKFDSSNDVPFAVDPAVLPISGSVASVRKVTHKITGEAFAQKTFHVSRAKRKSILTELGVIEVCNHPNIVSLVAAYEVADEPNTIHIVMAPWAPLTLQWLLYKSTDKERVEAFPSLKHEDVSSSSRRLHDLMMQLADVVAHLHSLPIKHKDIKPDNILLRPREGHKGIQVYLTDFGVSKVYQRDAFTDYTGGTYAYLSPEQNRNEESSLSSDVWQLGCCFALILALGLGGSRAVWTLHESYERTDEQCSCNIAKESTKFMATLEGLSVLGTTDQVQIYRIVTRMLDLNSLSRFSMETVRAELQKVLVI